MRMILLLATLLAASLALAQGEEATLESTITGNQEQPQVSYIVPWQDPEGPELTLELSGSAATGVFDHLERDQFRRELHALPEVPPVTETATKTELQEDE